jgi:hypothetical protein
MPPFAAAPSSTGPRGTSAERGSAMFILTVAMVMCAGMAIALVTVAAGRKRSVDSRVAMQSAMSIAEAGLDRGLIEANNNKSVTAWPIHGTTWTSGDDIKVRSAETGTDDHGTFVLEFLRGDSDGVDNDGDGQIDAADVTGTTEDSYIRIRSTGYYGTVSDENPSKVRLETLLLKTTNQFNVNSALYLDDVTPDVALSTSAAWKLSGNDHTETGTTIAAAPKLPAVSASGNFNATDMTFMNNKQTKGQLTGSVDPVTGKVYKAPITDNIDLDAIVDWAKTAADVYADPGDGPGGVYPSPAPGEYKITYTDGNSSVAGAAKGAGIWIVNGNLELKGTIKFAGIIIVTGSLSLSGGGSGNMVTGAVISGDGATINYSNNGTTDLLYSSAAVNKAKNAAAKWSVATWQQLPNEE